MSACLRERERGWWARREEDKRAKGQDQRGGGGSRKATASGVLGLGLSPVWCVWHQLCVSVDSVVSDGKHHCGSVADAVCVCHVVCVCEWGDGVGGGRCGMVWSTHSTPWCVWWCM